LKLVNKFEETCHKSPKSVLEYFLVGSRMSFDAGYAFSVTIYGPTLNVSVFKLYTVTERKNS